jgi:hypothetical protein
VLKNLWIIGLLRGSTKIGERKIEKKISRSLAKNKRDIMNGEIIR